MKKIIITLAIVLCFSIAHAGEWYHAEYSTFVNFGSGLYVSNVAFDIQPANEYFIVNGMIATSGANAAFWGTAQIDSTGRILVGAANVLGQKILITIEPDGQTGEINFMDFSKKAAITMTELREP